MLGYTREQLFDFPLRKISKAVGWLGLMKIKLLFGHPMGSLLGRVYMYIKLILDLALYGGYRIWGTKLTYQGVLLKTENP